MNKIRACIWYLVVGIWTKSIRNTNYQLPTTKYGILPILLLLSISQTSFAQEESVRDFETWMSIELKVDLPNKFEAGILNQLRLDDTSSATNLYFTQLNVSNEVLKNFTLAIGARFISKNDNEGKKQGYENFVRWQADASYKHKFNDLSIGYRLRYQHKNQVGLSKADGDEHKQDMRFKLSLGYNIPKWKFDPKVAAEVFNRFGDNEDNGELTKFRLTVGTSYKIKKFGKISAAYRYERSLNKEITEIADILIVKYSYTF